LGILAHVDAGKTPLTERLLYAAGVIDERVSRTV
jgi:ribosomal protection tetracycline resistance protein